jgi:FAD:protein FMN transferase
MGTVWRVRFAGSDTGVEEAIVARLATLVAELSHWRPDSALSRFNRAPAGTWVPLPPDLAQVVAAGLAVAAASGGAFDPAIGRLVDLWGHGPPGPQPPPSSAALTAARAASGWRRLAFDAPARRLRQPGGCALDLSGIAKGHAADALAATLGDLGVRHALIEVGGELVGRGLKPNGDPWWVDLETPGPAPPLRVALHQGAVATSGSYIRGQHTIDPRTGAPTTSDVVAASVLHASAMYADAWASALCVLDAGAAIALADSHALAARVVTATGERLSQALAAML